VKIPSFQFYPGDWLKDPALRRVSKASKGLWIELICLSFECEERGVFSTNGIPWPDEDIAAAVGGDRSENLKLLHELLEKGVCSRTAPPKNGGFGAIFCRRVVRDEQLRQKRIAAGKLGGNPILLNHTVNHEVNQHSNQNPTPSSSSSSSSSQTTRKKHLTVEHSTQAPDGKNGHAQCSSVECAFSQRFYTDAWLPETEKDFIALMGEITHGMENFGGFWRNSWRSNKAKCRKVLVIFRDEAKQKVFENPGGWMADLLKKRLP
jgi:hypothetical protein